MGCLSQRLDASSPTSNSAKFNSGAPNSRTATRSSPHHALPEIGKSGFVQFLPRREIRAFGSTELHRPSAHAQFTLHFSSIYSPAATSFAVSRSHEMRPAQAGPASGCKSSAWTISYSPAAAALLDNFLRAIPSAELRALSNCTKSKTSAGRATCCCRVCCRDRWSWLLKSRRRGDEPQINQRLLTSSPT